jgi:sugar O-acyltransferase (sialic acid O-acetyltransferase NeuD family)
MKEIILIGGGGHCRSVIDVIEQEGQFKIVGIIDKAELFGTDVLGYPVFGSDLDIENLAKKYSYALVTIGQIKSSEQRVKLFELAKKSGFILPSIFSPRAYISKHALIGSGVVVMHDALINANASIGDNCIINSKALIEHDSQVGEHCHISTNTTINGSVIIEPECFIGSGSVLRESIIIKKNSFIKAGSLIK